MKRITYNTIKDLGPCYDPIKYIPLDWNGTIVDILANKEIPVGDRLWVAVRNDFMTDIQFKYYGLYCARMCESNTTDIRVKNCNDVVDLYLKGNASLEELLNRKNVVESAARDAWAAAWCAESAARSAAWCAAAESAESAAESAARAAECAAWCAAAEDAAECAAECAAWCAAAEDAAECAAECAAKCAAWSAARAAARAAKCAAQELQCLYLIKILGE